MKPIQTVLNADEMLDKAFRRVKKVSVTDLKGLKRNKAESAGRLSALSNTLMAQINKYVRAFPSIDRLHPFERELIDILIGVDKLKHSLGAIAWARKTIGIVQKEEMGKIKQANMKGLVIECQNRGYARISSIMGRVEEELRMLISARNKLRKMPDINMDEPMIVIAGAPNVGKSLIVRSISSGKPEIAPYPFTTKGISIGHMSIQNNRVQVMDTPGLLDRPLEERNPIELQAIIALEHIADIIVFVFDPSESCGYSLEAQKNLLRELEETFDTPEFIIVSNKSDLKTSDLGLPMSALKGQGMDELISGIAQLLSNREKSIKRKEVES